ncbi:MAG: glycosyltransferase family 2 protein [Rhodobacteraceae bacterium]|nr:glycosyltransferase family 2 protein [Paracoccaceae bacterium]
MKAFIHIGVAHCGAEQIQAVLNDKRDQLAKKSVLYPSSPGRKNHTKLFMAMTDPRHLDPLRYHRGHGPAQKQAILREKLQHGLEAEIEQVQPNTLILSAHQLSVSLLHDGELQRLKDFVSQFAKDITVVMHIDEQARVLARHYSEQVMSGRYAPLGQELKLDKGNWAELALVAHQSIEPHLNRFPEVQAPPHWLDYKSLIARWGAVFGAKAVRVRAYDPDLFASPKLMDELQASFDLPSGIGKTDGVSAERPESEQTLACARAVNNQLMQGMEKGQIVTRQVHHRITKSVRTDGDPIDPGSLSGISKRFAEDNAALIREHPAIGKAALKPEKAQKDWQEARTGKDFKPGQVVEGFQRRIDKLTTEYRAVVAKEMEKRVKDIDYRQFVSDIGERMLPDIAKNDLPGLAMGRFKPRNDIGNVDEEAELKQYSPMEPRNLPNHSSGNVIVGCMKNEAPYILEWVAYHRAMGIDNFLIYTNGCEDGTVEILDRLQAMGVLYHEDNNEWKGNSPQQHALNCAVKHPLVMQADWVAHIDIDEFINVRIGNGTLPEFFERIGDATNVAMTWRLFGHNGIHKFEDRLVIEQFDQAAPKFCPKPHTVWGFKTMYRNIGAYEKISCHRTTKLRENFRDDVIWVNGSGKTMDGSIADNGWRSSLKTIGYDLIQLNHYALRSAESYLIKRQRGRALHVDRSIGLNYWLRMDFNSYKDVTIQRNIDRTNEELDRLKSDAKLRAFHESGLDWHRAKAVELHKEPEFENLYQQAVTLKLNDLERVAWCLANDLET